MGIRAKETRGVTASWAHLAGVSVPDRMDAFAMFYLKDLNYLKRAVFARRCLLQQRPPQHNLGGSMLYYNNNNR